jgi:2-polyprenyl-3-methyl-5-hydroxy-6-metoxy-1,4-benzoquinol methylase
MAAYQAMNLRHGDLQVSDVERSEKFNRNQMFSWIRADMTTDTIERLATERDRVGSTWGQLNHWRLQAVIEFGGQRVLDVGCSRGAYVLELRRRGYKAFGTDLLVANEWPQSRGSSFSIANVYALPFQDEYFDTVLMFEVLEHLARPQLALNEISRVARRNVILSVPNCATDAVMRESGVTYNHWMDRTHAQAFTTASLAKLLDSTGFRVQEMRQINPIRPELLVFSSWGLPIQIARLASKLVARYPLRRRYFMTLLAVGTKP